MGFLVLYSGYKKWICQRHFKNIDCVLNQWPIHSGEEVKGIIRGEHRGLHSNIEMKLNLIKQVRRSIKIHEEIIRSEISPERKRFEKTFTFLIPGHLTSSSFSNPHWGLSLELDSENFPKYSIGYVLGKI
jgi:hypothetical protein